MAGAIPKQTQEDIVPPAPIAVGYRLAGVLLAAPVAVATQLAIEAPFGVDLRIPDAPGSAQLQDLSLLQTALFVLALSLVSWLAVVLLERGLGRERGRRIFMAVAFAVLAVSILPIAAIDVPLGAQWGLVALHSVVALVLIPTMAARGTPGHHPTTSNPDPEPASEAGEDHISDQHDHEHETTSAMH